MRIALGVQYDGAGFRGWQSQQPGVRTVQACLEQGLTRVAAHPVKLICAGRTDAGVHGVGQVVHFDTTAVRTARSWVLGGNANLPMDISLHWACAVPDEFHARFSALARCYRYLICNRPYRAALWRQRATWHYHPLEAVQMHTAAQALVGEHDFSSFRAAECQARHPIREIYRLEVRRQGDFVVLEVEANAFLHHMVRNIVGCLVYIGKGKYSVDWMRQLLASCDRTYAAPTFSPAGLYLAGVKYDTCWGLPESSRKPIIPGLSLHD